MMVVYERILFSFFKSLYEKLLILPTILWYIIISDSKDIDLHGDISITMFK